MKNLFLISVSFVSLVSFQSCGNNKIEACANFDQSAYSINDTMYLDAACSENVDDYLWTPQAGLQMLGDGKSSTERFIVLSLPSILSREVKLEVSNKKSSRSITKSALVL